MSSTFEDSAVGARLFHIRQRESLSQQQFAESLEISLRTYQNYERGDRPVSKELICTLMSLYKVDPAWLLSGDLSSNHQLSEGTSIDAHLFDMVQEALAGEDSELRGVNTIDFGKYAVLIYNQVCEVSDKNERKKVVDGAVKMLSIASLKDYIKNTVECDPATFPGDKQELIDILQNQINKLESSISQSIDQDVNGNDNQAAGQDIDTKKKMKK